jgi:hypothetical protein
MSQTYRAVATGVTFASNKSMLTVFNGSGSGRVIRVKRIWQLNNQTSGVTGVLTTMEVRRISASSGGTAVTPVKHDSTSESMPAQVACATGPTDTLTGDAALMRYMWSNDEPAASSLTNDETEVIPVLACVFDCATGDADLEPVVLREGQGLCLRHTGSTTVGICDVVIEYTMAST